jgi:tight adherence protein B
MLRPVEGSDADVNITRKRKDHQNAVAIILRQVNLLKNLEQTMWQAGLYWRVGDVLLIILLLAGAGFAGAYAFWGDFYFGIGGAIGAGALPIMYIRFRRKRRLKAFGNQLPFALDLIKGSLEAGHSLPRALQVLIGEFADPLGSEFRTVLEQTRIGLPLGRALEDMLQRVP